MGTRRPRKKHLIALKLPFRQIVVRLRSDLTTTDLGARGHMKENFWTMKTSDIIRVPSRSSRRGESKHMPN